MIVEEDDGKKHIKLIQPITVGYFHRNDLKRYLDRANATWGSSHEVNDLTPIPGSHGRYYLLVIAGHRRTMAVAKAAEDMGVPVENIDIVFHLYNGTETTFRDGIRTQYRENFHKRPESWEDAFAINAILGEGLNNGEYATFADCARDLGVDPDRVSRAYRFQTLPVAIQTMVRDKVLHFSRSLDLVDLCVARAYHVFSQDKDEEALAEFKLKFSQNKLYLPELWEFLSAKEQADLEDDFYHDANKLTTFSNAGQAKQYVADSIEGLFNADNQLTLIQVSEDDIIRTNRTKQRTETRDDVVRALRTLVAVLRADVARIDEHEKTVLSGSPLVISQLELMRRGLHAVARHQRDQNSLDFEVTISAALEAGESLLQTFGNSSDEVHVDPFTEATRNLVPTDTAQDALAL